MYNYLGLVLEFRWCFFGGRYCFSSCIGFELICDLDGQFDGSMVVVWWWLVGHLAVERDRERGRKGRERRVIYIILLGYM